jgi:hypothetical protein
MSVKEMFKRYAALLCVLACVSFPSCADDKKTNVSTKPPASNRVESSQSSGGGLLDYDRLPATSETSYYIVNTKTKKYHKPSCSYLPSAENSKKVSKSGIAGYSPCGHCFG